MPNSRPGAAFPAVEPLRPAVPSWKRLGSATNLLRAVAVGTVVLTVALYALLAMQTHSRNRQEVQSRLLYTLDLVHEHAVKVMETQALVTSQVQEMLRGYDDDDVRADETNFKSRLTKLSEALPQIQGSGCWKPGGGRWSPPVRPRSPVTWIFRTGTTSVSTATIPTMGHMSAAPCWAAPPT